VAGASVTTDLFSGVIPQDRDSLRRVTVLRMICDFTLRAETVDAEIEANFGVTEVTEDAFLANISPDVGVDEIGFYLAQELSHRQSIASDAAQFYHRDYDIRSSRALRGSGRTLMFTFANLSSAAQVKIWFNFRLLVAYG